MPAGTQPPTCTTPSTWPFGNPTPYFALASLPLLGLTSLLLLSTLWTSFFARLWDANGLLVLSREGPPKERPFEAVRLNALKSATTDPQIADRRGRNHVEGTIPGPSRELPSGPALLCLHLDPSRHAFSICATDRKDFYHHLKNPSKEAEKELVGAPT